MFIQEFVHFSVVNGRHDVVAAAWDDDHFHFHAGFLEGICHQLGVMLASVNFESIKFMCYRFLNLANPF